MNVSACELMKQEFSPVQFESHLVACSFPLFVPVSIVALGMFQCPRSTFAEFVPGRFARPMEAHFSPPSQHA